MTIKLPPIILDSVTKKFTQLNDSPKPEKQPKVELTEDDKAGLIADFKEVMGRPPDEAEKESLFVEERKIKQGRRQQ